MPLDEKIYKRIAEEFGVTVEEVKRDMEEALQLTYADPNCEASAIPRMGSVPTIDEFVDYAAARVKSERKRKSQT